MVKKKVHKKKVIKKKLVKKVSRVVFKKKAKAKSKCIYCKLAKVKKRIFKKKPARKKPVKNVALVVNKAPPGILVGEVVHFYPQISVAVVEVKKSFKKGDKLTFLGKGISFTQTAESMQIDYKDIALVNKGDAIGMKVAMPVKEKVKVYKVNKN